MSDNSLYEVQGKFAPKDGYITFAEEVDGTSKMEKWKFLIITTAPSK